MSHPIYDDETIKLMEEFNNLIQEERKNGTLPQFIERLRLWKANQIDKEINKKLVEPLDHSR